MKQDSTKQDTSKIGNKTFKTPIRRNCQIMLIYRWLIFLFSVILCIANDGLPIKDYAILESLAIAAMYNGVITAYTIHNGKKYAALIQYMDIMMIMLMTYFSGGIQSDLYVFLFFIIGFCGTKNEVTIAMKTGLASIMLYTATCLLVSWSYATGINYSTLVIRDLLFIMAAFAISGINHEVRKYDELRKKEFRLARTDKLTGLANRHYFDQKLIEEVDYALNTGNVLNVLMFDLDNFKGYNDTYGHAAGDKLLVAFAGIIMQSVRKSDIPVRYGGEEFMVLIRDLDIIIAKSVGDRIRRQLEKQRSYLGQYEERQRVTVSCGVAQFPKHSGNIKEVIEKSDQALYYAKEIGKNIVVCFDEIGLSRETIENELKKS